MLSLHKKWVFCIASAIYGQILLCALSAPIKFWNKIDWLDIVGEGGTALLILLWLYFVLAARPGGRVTNFFAAGLLGLFVGTSQDALDEIFRMGPLTPWHSIIESVTMPIGMVLMTMGLYHWRQEQRVVNQQLKKREQLFREHKSVDNVTQISDLAYLKTHIQLMENHNKQPQQPFSLLMLDLQQFHLVNNNFGTSEGDRVLYALSELLMLNLRSDDLVCRYAGDRFAILLPNTREFEAHAISRELIAAIEHFAFRSLRGERIQLCACVGVASARQDSVDGLLQRAKQALRCAKDETSDTLIAV